MMCNTPKKPITVGVPKINKKRTKTKIDDRRIHSKTRQAMSKSAVRSLFEEFEALADPPAPDTQDHVDLAAAMRRAHIDGRPPAVPEKMTLEQ